LCIKNDRLILERYPKLDYVAVLGV
jgi:hypothetical protein